MQAVSKKYWPLTTRGQALILGTLLSIGLLALLGAVIDVGYLTLQKQNLQAALDAAALATLPKAYTENANATTTLTSLFKDNSSDLTGNAQLSVTYPYQNNTMELLATLITQQKFLFNKYLQTSSHTFTIQSHVGLKVDQSEWPYFQYDIAHSGQNKSTTFVPSLKKAWEFRALGNTRTSAIIKDGVVYFGAGTYLYAVNAADGTEKWKYNIGTVDGCTPVYANGKIYIGTNYATDTVYCFNTLGGVAWSTHLKNIGTSAPLGVDTENVYLQSSADGRLYVYDASTGQPIVPNVPLPLPAGNPSYLNQGLAGPEGTGGYSAPALYNNKVFFATGGSGSCIAYNVGTWTKAWSLTGLAGGGVLDSPAIYDNKLYYGGTNTAFCFNPETGATLWTHTTGARVSTLAGAEGKVIVSTNGKLKALDALSGIELWASGANHFSLVAIANGYVYSINSQNNRGLKVYKLSDGSEAWIGPDTIDVYLRDNAPAVGWGLVVCPGNTSKKIIAYKPTALGKAYLMP